jgi:hypothetical protein
VTTSRSHNSNSNSDSDTAEAGSENAADIEGLGLGPGVRNGFPNTTRPLTTPGVGGAAAARRASLGAVVFLGLAVPALL